MSGRNLVTGIALVAFMALYAATVHLLHNLSRIRIVDNLAVTIPAVAQVVLAGGDRYLAANIETVRAMMVSADLHDAETYHVLGEVQRGAALLNPAHEDNYYIAQAVLPWVGEVKANQEIQQRATDARTWDYLPPFFLGFNRFYFFHDPTSGAAAVKIAADRSTSNNRLSLTAMAARWYEHGDDPQLAIGLIKALAESTRHTQLKAHLEQRITRLKGLIELREAVARYRTMKGESPKQLSDLVELKLLPALPNDPFGLGYRLNKEGMPELVMPAAKQGSAQ